MLSRRQLLRWGGQLGMLATLGGLAVACGSSGASSSSKGGAYSASHINPTTSRPKAGGTLNAALTGIATSMDPAAPGIYTSSQVIDNIFSTLLVMDIAGNLMPQLARSWKQTSPTEWTFDLVDNATFHNGEKFTSADVKYSIERYLDPKTAATSAGALAPIDGITMPSPTTQVVFHLKQPFGPLLTNLAVYGQILNQKAVESLDPKLHPIGTGPFRLAIWVQNSHATVTKFPAYFQTGKPYLDTVDFEFLNVDQSRVEALSSGQMDWVDAVPLNELASLSQSSQYNYVTSATGGIPPTSWPSSAAGRPSPTWRSARRSQRRSTARRSCRSPTTTPGRPPAMRSRPGPTGSVGQRPTRRGPTSPT